MFESKEYSTEVRDILHSSGKAQTAFHDQAGSVRDAHFGKQIFVRGVVEVSNYCRQNCSYCGMRRDNKGLSRYRMSLDPLLDLILNHRPQSITDINIQAGEDPIVVREIVIPLIKEIRKHTNLGVSVCLGTLSNREYAEIKRAGVDFYILKLETGDEEHYRKVNAPGTLARRIEAIKHLATTGWKVSSGLIVGLPDQTEQHLLTTVEVLRNLPLAGWSVSPFIAGDQTPLKSSPNGELEKTLNCMVAMRLLSPDRIIPAVSAMGLVGQNGYTRAIRAGANLATINLTPPDIRENYLLYKRDRLIMNEQRVLKSIQEAGCSPSSISLTQYLADTQLTTKVA
jgi:biotin synthase